MSACISRHGEYSEHTPDGEYTCQRCLVLDEDALRAELRRLRTETTTEATERIARQIAATTAMTGLDARECVKAVQAMQRAETTTATTEDTARVLEQHAPMLDETAIYTGRCDCDWYGMDHEAHQAQALADAGLLACPLPDRDQIAQALRAHRTNGLCMLGVECDLCDCDSPARKDGLALRDADAVLDLLRGGGGDR